MREHEESSIWQYMFKATPFNNQDVILYLNKYGKSPSSADPYCESSNEIGCAVNLEVSDLSPSMSERMVRLLLQSTSTDL